MEEGAKRRLAGATVIVILIVIFVPMFFEEDRSAPPANLQGDTPPEPPWFESDRPESEGGAGPMGSGSGIPVLPRAERDEAPRDVSARSETDVEASLEPPPLETTRQRIAPSVPNSPPSEPPAPPPPAFPPPSGVTGPGWIVQVASLTREARALALAKELRDAGFSVFIEPAEVRGRRYHRVRIGPLKSRSAVRDLAQDLLKRTGYEGQIQRYP